MQNYRILGADGQEYGPINADGLRQWIAQKRVVTTTSVQAEGSPGWRPLSTFPEFADALMASQPASAASGFTPPMPPLHGPVRTSRLAIGSLICGCLGFLCLPGVVGVILGIVALVQIGKSKGQLRGQGLAIAGIALAAFMMFILVPIGAALLLPALARARALQFNPPMNGPTVITPERISPKGQAERIQCVNNLKQIGLGARIYSNDHNDSFPPDFLSMSNELNLPKILVCPADTQHPKASTWAEFDAKNNLTYEYLKPGIAESNALNQIIFRCPIHHTVGMGDGSVHQRP